MKLGRPETSLGVKDWKAHDVCGRHQEPISKLHILVLGRGLTLFQVNHL